MPTDILYQVINSINSSLLYTVLLFITTVYWKYQYGYDMTGQLEVFVTEKIVAPAHI